MKIGNIISRRVEGKNNITNLKSDVQTLISKLKLDKEENIYPNFFHFDKPFSVFSGTSRTGQKKKWCRQLLKKNFQNPKKDNSFL